MNITDLLVVAVFVSFLIGYAIGCAVGIKRGKESEDKEWTKI